MAPKRSKRPVWPAPLCEGGAAGELIRSIDWTATPLGAVEDWPISLKSLLGILLCSRHPMFLWWGPQLTQFYNDAYTPSFGQGKHPLAMGQAGRDCWQEIWPIIWPQIDDVMRHGKSSWNEDQLVPIFRNGRIEEVYWTYGYSPAFDDHGAIAGTLVVCTETTARVLADVAARAARELDERTSLATDSAELQRCAADVFAREINDITFALTYAWDPSNDRLQWLESIGVSEPASALLDALVQQHPVTSFAESKLLTLPTGVWPGLATQAYVVPILTSPEPVPSGFIVFGLAPTLPFDAAYREHLLQLSRSVGVAEARIAARSGLDRAHDERARLLTELEAASRAKDEFLAMLGHELRNPLSPIVSALELMKRREGGNTARAQAIIERQVAHLVRLVDDLLDISKITRGKIELRKETLEIGEICAKAVEMASLLFEQRNHLLTVDVPRQGLSWEGDPVRLAQVVANLLTNAARYTPNGGQITLRARRERDQIVICVNDNGVGIAAESLPRIFDLFVQGKRSPDRAEGGLGLGLALVKSLVTMHGGSVTAHSEGLGRGSEFVIRLPCASQPLARPTPAASPRPKARLADRQKRILVVDDNQDAAELLGDILRNAGHDVNVVTDPLAALSAVETFKPEVAVLDIGLPVMDGYELATRMRDSAAGADCRLIALTGYGQAHDHQRSSKAGFANHLVKPVDVDRLLQLLSA